MSAAETENRLERWRYGQTQAERLTAALLHLEGFREVDPQHPLGGPDGVKDVLCRKGGILWVAAAYFPPTPPPFVGIRDKFNKDVLGVVANGATGFAFFVNQRLSAGERRKLTAESPAPRNAIYHLERMCSILDSPRGWAARSEYLRIEMTKAERWSDMELRRGIEFQKIGRKLDLLAHRTMAIHRDLLAQPSSVTARPRVQGMAEPATSALTVSILCWLHHIVTDAAGLPKEDRGRIRDAPVWIGGGPSRAERALVPTPPGKIIAALDELLEWWRKRHVRLRREERPEIALGLADFHHRFFLIHPFIDGNGRVARLVLDQAARELLGHGLSMGFTTPPADYYSTLRYADGGNLEPLQQRILAMLE